MSGTSAEVTANRGPSILAVSWTECAVAILIVSARMYARSFLIHNVGMDDWVMLLALVSFCLSFDSPPCPTFDAFYKELKMT